MAIRTVLVRLFRRRGRLVRFRVTFLKITLFSRTRTRRRTMPLRATFRVIVRLRTVLLRPCSPFFVKGMLCRRNASIERQVNGFSRFPVRRVRPIFLVRRRVFPVRISITSHFLQIISTNSTILRVFDDLLRC